MTELQKIVVYDNLTRFSRAVTRISTRRQYVRLWDYAGYQDDSDLFHMILNGYMFRSCQVRFSN